MTLYNLDLGLIDGLMIWDSKFQASSFETSMGGARVKFSAILILLAVPQSRALSNSTCRVQLSRYQVVLAASKGITQLLLAVSWRGRTWSCPQKQREIVHLPLHFFGICGMTVHHFSKGGSHAQWPWCCWMVRSRLWPWMSVRLEEIGARTLQS